MSFDVVISYKSDEKGRTGFVVALLEAAGFKVWWADKLSAGQSYDSVILETIDNAKCVVVLWSQASVISDWVRGEAKIADAAGKLIPVLLDEARLPPPFNMRHNLNLKGWKGDPAADAWLALVRAVRAKVDPSGKTAMRLEAYKDEVISRSGHLIHKLKAKDSSGKWAYYFLLVPPDREKAFLQAIEGDGMIDLSHLGTVIASCYGESPSPEIKQYLKTRYGFDT